MAYRKFLISYNGSKVSTKEVPFSKQEWDQMGMRKAPTFKMKQMPDRKTMQKAVNPMQNKPKPIKSEHDLGGRTEVIVNKCLAQGIYDAAEIEALIRESYIGSGRNENYILKRIGRAIRFIELKRK